MGYPKYKNYNCLVHIRLSRELRELVKEVARRRGTYISSWIRELILKELARLSYLSEEDKKALGV